MKRVLIWGLLAGMALPLGSCKLIGPAARSVGALGRTVAPLIKPAMTAAAL